MVNSLKNSKYFNIMNKKYDIEGTLQKTDMTKYFVPRDLYIGRIDIFKGYKLPFTKEIYEYVTKGKLIPVILSESYDTKKIYPNLILDKNLPNSMYTIISNQNGKLVCLVNTTSKGKYEKSKNGDIIYYDIPDLLLYYFLMAGYINLRLIEDPTISENSDFLSIVSSAYSNLLYRLIDADFLITSVSSENSSRLAMLCAAFCLQNMFGVPKDKAIKQAMKMKTVNNKDMVITNSIYINSDMDFMFSNTGNQNNYPIDNFAEVIRAEFNYIKQEKFNPSLLLLKWCNKYTTNSTYAMENAFAFLNMLVLSLGSLGLYNDGLIKNFLKMEGNILKDLSIVIK